MPSKPPFHKQETRFSCVPACPRMVLLRDGLDVPESDPRTLCDSTILGTDALKAVDAARHLGFTRSAKYTLALYELRTVVGLGKLPIVFVSMLPIDARADTHAVIVTGLTEQGVLLLDPVAGEREIPLNTFTAAWGMRHNLTILIER